MAPVTNSVSPASWGKQEEVSTSARKKEQVGLTRGRSYSQDDSCLPSKRNPSVVSRSYFRGEGSSGMAKGGPDAQNSHSLASRASPLNFANSPSRSDKRSSFSLPSPAKPGELPIDQNSTAKSSSESAPAAAPQVQDWSTGRKVAYIAFVAFAALALTTLVFFPPTSAILLLVLLFAYYGAIGALIIAPPINDFAVPSLPANNSTNQPEKKDDSKIESQKKNDSGSSQEPKDSIKARTRGFQVSEVIDGLSELGAYSKSNPNPGISSVSGRENSQQSSESSVGFGEMLMGGIGYLFDLARGVVKSSDDDKGDYRAVSRTPEKGDEVIDIYMDDIPQDNLSEKNLLTPENAVHIFQRNSNDDAMKETESNSLIGRAKKAWQNIWAPKGYSELSQKDEELKTFPSNQPEIFQVEEGDEVIESDGSSVLPKGIIEAFGGVAAQAGLLIKGAASVIQNSYNSVRLNFERRREEKGALEAESLLSSKDSNAFEEISEEEYQKECQNFIKDPDSSAVVPSTGPFRITKLWDAIKNKFFSETPYYDSFQDDL